MKFNVNGVEISSNDLKPLRKKRNENYYYLIGYNMGDWIYNGMYWCTDENGKRYANNQYEFIHVNGKSRWIATYAEFKEYISGYDIEALKKY